MSGSFHGCRDLLLIFQAIAGDTSGQYFPLFVDKLLEKIRILVINVTDSILAKTAVFLLLLTQLWIAEKLYIVS